MIPGADRCLTEHGSSHVLTNVSTPARRAAGANRSGGSGVHGRDPSEVRCEPCRSLTGRGMGAPMRILLLCSAFNGLTQRAWIELREAGHDVSPSSSPPAPRR